MHLFEDGHMSDRNMHEVHIVYSILLHTYVHLLLFIIS
jgi:hypothetical protein